MTTDTKRLGYIEAEGLEDEFLTYSNIFLNTEGDVKIGKET